MDTRDASRRSFLLGLAAAAGALRSARLGAADTPQAAAPRQLRVRTLTAGVPLASLADVRPVEEAIDALLRSKRRVEEAGYEVQTLRVAMPSILGGASARDRQAALAAVQRLDDLVARRNVILSIGSILTDDRSDPGLAAFATDLVHATRVTSFSVTIASKGGGRHRHSTMAAAEVMLALSRSTTGGIGNFRFAAAANVPAGTPFFPVAHHDGPAAFAVGLESPRLLRDAIGRGGDLEGVEQRLRESLDAALTPVAMVAEACARDERRAYLGIDPSPAPGLDSSIGAVVEAITGRPFGGPSTLDACALVTGALKQLQVKTCGYAGLMLPVLEDPVLARRAAEGRYGLRDLLLFSSVCGTGLDVVPVPGDTTPDALARVVADVAALSVRLRKPLSARLFPVPGKRAGDAVTFDDPMLTGSVAFRVE